MNIGLKYYSVHNVDNYKHILLVIQTTTLKYRVIDWNNHLKLGKKVID